LLGQRGKGFDGLGLVHSSTIQRLLNGCKAGVLLDSFLLMSTPIGAGISARLSRWGRMGNPHAMVARARLIG